MTPVAAGNEPQVTDGEVGGQAELPGAPASVGTARQVVSRALQEWSLHHLDDTAALLTSELVTNAVLHAGTDLRVEVQRTGGVVRVTVHDGSLQRPRRKRPGVQAGTGRGIGLLATLATDWGSGPSAPPWRKAVWFELPVDPAALPDPGDGALL